MRVIRLLSDPNDVVLDCFMGSGSTAIASIRSGRRFIGMDIESQYTALARENIRLEREKIFLEKCLTPPIAAHKI